MSKTEHCIDWRKTASEIDAEYTSTREANERLITALRLLMNCAGDIQDATDSELEAALECGDSKTERQANAWLVARNALKTANVELTGLRASCEGPVE